MTDPARWAFLNESEREVLRQAAEYRGASFTGKERHVMHLAAAAIALTSDDPPPVVVEMPEGYSITEAIIPPGAMLLLKDGYPDLTLCSERLHLGDAMDRDVPTSALAALLRSAGWRVEGPK